ncbi:MAG: ribosome biogenesis GTPase Der [Bacteroidia bacterium]|nr:ribosome biogenesis GTPase Der [Bacteroidia bacterium]
MKNLVAIVGRPNVGKSTFFNRLIGEKLSIVDSTPGVTRDRIYGQSEWKGKKFIVVDTGGYLENNNDDFQPHISAHVKIALEECDYIFFLTDLNDGITEDDKIMARLVRKYGKPVFLIVNKCDSPLQSNYAAIFYELGFDRIFPISAINGSGTGELLDALTDLMPPDPLDADTEIPRLAIVGRPNAGKSSLVNTLLGEEKNIVTPVAGTTRDSIDSYFNKFGHEWILVDTAGLRKKSRIKENIEFYSLLRTVKAIERADVCLLLLDAEHGMEAQDLSILQYILDNRKPVVIAVNKWDLIQKDNKTSLEWEKNIRERTAPFRDFELFFVSVHEKQRLLKILDAAKEALERSKQNISTSELNDFFLPLMQTFTHPIVKGKEVKVKYVSKVKGEPVFIFYCNLPQYVNDSYKRFLENKLRERWNFKGVPIVISFRKK